MTLLPLSEHQSIHWSWQQLLNYLFYSVLRFTSWLSFLYLNTNPYTDPDNSCLTISSIQSSVLHHLNTHPYTDPDNSCLTIMALSVLYFSSQWDPLLTNLRFTHHTRPQLFHRYTSEQLSLSLWCPLSLSVSGHCSVYSCGSKTPYITAALSRSLHLFLLLLIIQPF